MWRKQHGHRADINERPGEHHHEMKAKVQPAKKGPQKANSGASSEQTAEKPTAPTTANAVPRPTPTELAVIAAALGRNAGGSRDLPALASDALRLWETCEKEIRESRERILPVPKHFPLSLKEFLELLLPQRSTADREKAFRHFLMDWSRKKEITDVAERFTDFRNSGFSRETQVQSIGTLFQGWYRASLSIQKRLNAHRRLTGLNVPKGGKAKYTKDDAQEEGHAAIMAAETTTGWID
ncbi:MAG: hypothetical protein ABSG04_10400 [Verrucomicrobiota bacterium]